MVRGRFYRSYRLFVDVFSSWTFLPWTFFPSGHYYRGHFFLVDVITVDVFTIRGHFFRGRFFRGRYYRTLQLYTTAVLPCENLSVCLSNAWIVTKRKNFCPNSYTIWKVDASSCLTWRMVGGGWPLLPEILYQSDPPLQKRRFAIYRRMFILGL